MKFLLLYPDWQPDSIDRLRCFSDVWGFYLGRELARHVTVTTQIVPKDLDDSQLAEWFDALVVDDYDAVLALGLRYFSLIPKDITDKLRRRLYPGFLCQIYDGSRLDSDGVDITFTIKDENLNKNYEFGATANRYVRHRAHNEYIGWAADSVLNVPAQNNKTLRFLIDHTNYGNNPIDRTDDIIQQIREFNRDVTWRKHWNELVVRRFDSGRIVTVDLDDESPVNRYDRTGLPYRDVCDEHGKTHVFFVTHPESVGLVVLETAMAGALTVTPQGFIPEDRLSTINHVTYKDKIDWSQVLENIDPERCRQRAILNSWEAVAKRVRDAVKIRKIIRRGAA